MSKGERRNIKMVIMLMIGCRKRWMRFIRGRILASMMSWLGCSGRRCLGGSGNAARGNMVGVAAGAVRFRAGLFQTWGMI